MLGTFDLLRQESMPGMVFDGPLATPRTWDTLEMWSHLLQPLHGTFDATPLHAFVQFTRCLRAFGADKVETGDSAYGPARWGRGHHPQGSWVYVETCGPEYPQHFMHFAPIDSNRADGLIDDWMSQVGFKAGA
jgi:hypothetical protein